MASFIIIDVLLRSDEGSLSEVVVTGYGTQQRKAFTGSASKIDAKQFSNLMTHSFDKQLAGKVVGVRIKNSVV